MSEAIRLERKGDDFQLVPLSRHLEVWIASIVHDVEASVDLFRPFKWRKYALWARNVDITGVCVDKFGYGNYVCFTLDDGSACITCCLLKPREELLQREAVALQWKRTEAAVAHGNVLRVMGSVKRFRKQQEVVVTTVKWERDPNRETLHWLECVETCLQIADELASIKALETAGLEGPSVKRPRLQAA